MHSSKHTNGNYQFCLQMIIATNDCLILLIVLWFNHKWSSRGSILYHDTQVKRKILPRNKGAIIFYREGGRLSVIAGRQFFLVPPPWHAQKILVPPLAWAKKFWSPLPWPTQKFWSPLCDPQKIVVPPPFDLLKKTGPPLWLPQKILFPPPPTSRRPPPSR